MRGGYASSFRIESKTFTMAVEHGMSPLLRVTQSKGTSRLSMYFGPEAAQWLSKTVTEFWFKKGEATWVRRRREVDRSFLLTYSRNMRGRFLRLTEVIGGGTRTIIVPEGRKAEGWWLFTKTVSTWAPLVGKGGTKLKPKPSRTGNGGLRLAGECPCCGADLDGVFVVTGGQGGQRGKPQSFSYADALKNGRGNVEEKRSVVVTRGRGNAEEKRSAAVTRGKASREREEPEMIRNNSVQAQVSRPRLNSLKKTQMGPAQPIVPVKNAMQTIIKALSPRREPSPIRSKALNGAADPALMGQANTSKMTGQGIYSISGKLFNSELSSFNCEEHIGGCYEKEHTEEHLAGKLRPQESAEEIPTKMTGNSEESVGDGSRRPSHVKGRELQPRRLETILEENLAIVPVVEMEAEPEELMLEGVCEDDMERIFARWALTMVPQVGERLGIPLETIDENLKAMFQEIEERRERESRRADVEEDSDTIGKAKKCQRELKKLQCSVNYEKSSGRARIKDDGRRGFDGNYE